MTSGCRSRSNDKKTGRRSHRDQAICFWRTYWQAVGNAPLPARRGHGKKIGRRARPAEVRPNRSDRKQASAARRGPRPHPWRPAGRGRALSLRGNQGLKLEPADAMLATEPTVPSPPPMMPKIFCTSVEGEFDT